MLNAVLDEDILWRDCVVHEIDSHLKPPRWVIFVVGFLIGFLVCFCCKGEEYNCNPIRQANVPYSAHLSDLESHCSRPDIYREEDRVTWAHKMTHGVNADLKNSTPSAEDSFFYVYNNKAFRVIKPRNVTMIQVKLRLPYIGTAFNTYFSTQAINEWNNDITFFLDEWCAYINGCMCGLELHLTDRTVASFDKANQLGLYSIIATKDLNQKDINDYIKYQMDRTELIKSALPNYNKQYYNTLKQYYTGKTDTLQVIRSE